MPFTELVVRAAIEAVSTVLPISASAHRAVARLWLGDDPTARSVMMAAWLGCLVALLVATRALLGEVVATIPGWLRRPRATWRTEAGKAAAAVLLAVAASTAVRLAIAAGAEKLGDQPLLVGAGLCATAVTLGSTLATTSTGEPIPSLLGALGVGAAHGLATVPGGSQAGAAYVMLCWLGIRGWRAIELSLAVSALSLAIELATALAVHPARASLVTWASFGALAVAALTGMLAAMMWRLLAGSNRTVGLLLWIVPLALAILAFAHALAGPVAAATEAPLSPAAIRAMTGA